jgi:hypothetical protein
VICCLQSKYKLFAFFSGPVTLLAFVKLCEKKGI